jgi:predicted small secreted protein
MRILKLVVLASVLCGLSACNTVKGAGKDIQSVGQKGEEIIKGK